MKNVAILFVVLMLSSCKGRYLPPKAELCAIGDGYFLQCNDPRLVEGKQDYDREYQSSINYLCTNPRDFEAFRNYCSTIRTKLIKCENEPKR
jgi:hypothetical protein